MIQHFTLNFKRSNVLLFIGFFNIMEFFLSDDNIYIRKNASIINLRNVSGRQFDLVYTFVG